ncbi:zinc metalloprotease [Actinomadura sediminis]|uniref:Peptide zinc metalloprotease protein n=1 Tax=Actinomadura sediminis TaxID=1038904 RepID=A0ABW3EH68_9ACTN
MSTGPTSTVDGAEPPAVLTLPTLVDGAELVGEFKNSGYREPPQLVSLPNRQLVRLPPLLFHVVKALHEHRHLAGTTDVETALDRVAEAVSREAGARLTGEQIVYLVDRKLAPLGVTTFSDGTAPPIVKANPFLALKFKVAVIPESVSSLLGGMFAWLLSPFAVIPVIAALILSEVWVFTSQSVVDALRDSILNPVGILVVMGLGVLSVAFHEVGHAAACRYGGVKPGVMGFGIYLVWPAFYTDITESYRLGRGGRLRTDLAGVYFNGVFIIALTLLYVQTGYQPLLVALLYVNLEILQQLLPTLRFDGYYIISDLAGIPDLFKYIKPILSRTLLRRPPDALLRDLKRWPQVFVAFWVLTVFPVMILQLGIIATQVPELLQLAWGKVRTLFEDAMAGGDPLVMIVAVLQTLLIVLPVVGLVLIVYSFGRRLLRWAIRSVRGPAPADRGPATGPVPDA